MSDEILNNNEISEEELGKASGGSAGYTYWKCPSCQISIQNANPQEISRHMKSCPVLRALKSKNAAGGQTLSTDNSACGQSTVD